MKRFWRFDGIRSQQIFTVFVQDKMMSNHILNKLPVYAGLLQLRFTVQDFIRNCFPTQTPDQDLIIVLFHKNK